MTTTEHSAALIDGYRSHMTEQEFETWALRERVPAEWVEGEVILMSPVSFDHCKITAWLLILMGLYADKHNLGTVGGSEFMNRLEGRRRIPDLFFVAKGRESLIQRTYLDGPADLVVELVSPDSESRDWRDKYLEYQSHGVREYWVIDPNSQHAEFYELRNGKYALIEIKAGFLHSPVLAGFQLKVDWLWQRPLPNAYETAKTLGII